MIVSFGIVGDRFFWFSDEEFARETLAGVNPYSIQLVKEWPLRSELEPQIYGPPESAITKEVIESQIIGYGTVEEAIIEKKLFVLEYHDLFLPYVSKLRKIKGTTLYGSRTLFFLTKQGTLKPLAIELTRPIMDGKPQWSKSLHLHLIQPIFGFGGLPKLMFLPMILVITNLLRTHCALEPFIIATNRQLSTMHPVYKLLHPHMRYTMEINSLAREVLICANGIIEISFSTKKYSMELSSMAYDKLWRFDLQALPNDLIHGGMALEDPNAPYGLKLTIEDYPFANDGLLIWDAIKQWVTEYINHYYSSSGIVESDQELQAWWTEIQRVGHGDKSEEPSDEEYIGQYMEPSWAENQIIKAAFERFNTRLEIEGIIDSRNVDNNLKNRYGAGVVPYELMEPFSGPGITGKGVPYGTSI
ncbi:Linoleate 13S-lipoxygenase 2-1 [Spatholobus suberectus]|nr:Linoleate 13S-lipoxygenase 2-1 [Spatholobus suberectus]